MLGCHEMFRRIRPEAVICYGTPFEEMKGRIIAVDYAETNHLGKGLYIKTVYAHVNSMIELKGGGSASGASPGNPKPKWEPKKEQDKRFLGEPDEIIESYDSRGDKRLTKIGKDGLAERERQFSSHNRPDKHSNPHDHTIDWSRGYPKLSSPINYPDGNIPDFKNYKEAFHMKTTKIHFDGYDSFESMDDFKFSLTAGREIVIKWGETEYTILNEGDNDDDFTICEADKPETEKVFKTVDELLDFTLKTGEVLKSIITQAEVNWRNI